MDESARRVRPPTVLDAAEVAQRLLADEATMSELWRHVILQSLDDYESDRRLRGLVIAAGGLRPAPPLVGDDRVDAALAALVEHLARRDGWEPPAWAAEPARTTRRWWFVDDLPGLRACALRESPLSFRKRGVFIGAGGLERA